MENKHFGIVTILDALGTRTASIDNAKHYLESVVSLQDDIVSWHKRSVDDLEADENARQIIEALKPRFFGDTILMTYEVIHPNDFIMYLTRMVIIINILIFKALARGILFRGAVSIGDYLENQNVVLGPAITDAASWHDKLEIIGVITTPCATNYIKSLYSKCQGTEYDECTILKRGVRMYDVPLNTKSIIRTYFMDWANLVKAFAKDGETGASCYYRIISKCDIPLGCEAKYSNTEKYFLEVQKELSESKVKVETTPENITT